MKPAAALPPDPSGRPAPPTLPTAPAVPPAPTVPSPGGPADDRLSGETGTDLRVPSAAPAAPAAPAAATSAATATATATSAAPATATAPPQGAARPARPGRAAADWRAYARLAKLDVLDYYLSIPLLIALLATAHHVDPLRAAAVLLLFLLGELAMCAAMVAFDDVTGYRDGSDAANYGPDAPARRLARKPLLSGALTEPQALRFAWAAQAACCVLWTGAVLAAPHRPLWAVLGTALCAVLGFQYSWWLKISYRGGQEVFLAALGWAYVLPPFGLLTGEAPGFVVVQALLFGLGPLLFGVYSNINDIAGDRSVGRITVAARCSAGINARFIAAISVAEGLLIVAASAFGWAPWWFSLLMTPVLVLRAAQFLRGLVRRDPLAARRQGIHLHRISTGLMMAASLLAGVLA